MVLGGGPYGGRRVARGVARRFWWVVGIAGLTYVLGWTVAAGVGAHDVNLVAGLLSLAVSVVALGVTLLQMALAVRPDASPEGVRKAADALAGQVMTLEGRQRARWLGDDVFPIDVRFHLEEGPTRNAANARTTGTLAGVHDYYRDLVPRRMVISGPGGSGKTVLAVDLLLALLDRPAAGEPVPVRFSLPDWDTRVPLERWMVGRLADDYRVPRAQAALFVRQRAVVPVLDGLDEMWSEDGGAQRAIAAVAEMNSLRVGKQSAPLIVTCRQEFLDELANDHGIRLVDVATVSVRRLTAAQVADYLGSRFADPGRWHGVLDRLTTEPDGVLAQGLSTPWRLTLAATAYSQETDGSPDELLAETTDEGVRQHLLTRFVDVTTRTYPRLNRRYTAYYDPDAVRRWLVFLAAHLDRTAGREVGGRRFSGSDIRLHELWPIVGAKATVRAASVLDAAVLLAVGYVSCRVLWLPTPGWAVVAVYAALYGLALVLQEEGVPKAPQRLSWSYARGVLGTWTTLALSGSVGIVVFGVLWYVGHRFGYFLTLGAHPAGLDFVLACLISGCLSGLLAPLVVSAVESREEPPLSVDPTLPIRQEMRRSVLVGSVCGVAAGALVRLPSAFPRHLTRLSTLLAADRTRAAASHRRDKWYNVWTDNRLTGFLDHWAIPHFARFPHGFPARWPGVCLWFTLVGLAAGYFSAALSRRYLAMLVVGVGRLPLGLTAFLTWCHSAGLLRTAGTAFQFRHRELQEWLAQQAPRPAPSPPDGS